MNKKHKNMFYTKHKNIKNVFNIYSLRQLSTWRNSTSTTRQVVSSCRGETYRVEFISQHGGRVSPASYRIHIYLELHRYAFAVKRVDYISR